MTKRKTTTTRIWIVVPTYNEKGNISRLMPQLSEVFTRNKINGRVLIVDDNSPDGTGQRAEELSGKYPISVLHREKKEGIGAAYIAGFKKCLEGGADVICEMDADLSHDPAYFPAIIDALKEADLVLGSRYIAGGGIVNWGLTRKVISRNANRLARRIAGIKIKDITGGYRAYRAEVLKSLDLDGIKSSGYAFQVELLYRVLEAGYRVKEVPIVFREREKGVSKLSRSEIVKFFLLCFRLRLERYLERYLYKKRR